MGLKVIRNLIVVILSLMAFGFITFVGQEDEGNELPSKDPFLAELASLSQPADPLMGEVSASLTAKMKAIEAKADPPKSVEVSPQAKNGLVSLDFHRTPIHSILNSLSPELNRVFILPPSLKKSLTLVSPLPLTPDAAFRTLVSVLTLSGFEVHEEGRVVRLIPLKETRTLDLSRLSAAEAGNFLEHFGRSKSSRYFLDAPNQRLILQGSGAELDQLEQLLHQVDKVASTKNQTLVESSHSF